MVKIIFTLMILGSFGIAKNQVECGKTLTTVWELKPQLRSLKLLASNEHNEKFCEPLAISNSNATVTLLNKKKEPLLKRRIFINSNLFYENENSKYRGKNGKEDCIRTGAKDTTYSYPNKSSK